MLFMRNYRRTLAIGACLYFALGLVPGVAVACEGAAQIGLQAEGGGGSKEINFKSEALNTVRNYEISNVGTAPMEITGPKLAEEGGVAEGTNFKIVTAIGKTEDLCGAAGYPEIININDKCYLGIKLLAKKKTATFEIKWGAREAANKTETGPIKSE